MSRIFWDTNLFIYLLEPNEEFSPVTKELRIRMLRRGDVLLTSTITLGEVLIKPMQAGDEQRCRKYERAISSAATLIPFDIKAARHYASIKSSSSVTPSDAVQLSCPRVLVPIFSSPTTGGCRTSTFPAFSSSCPWIAFLSERYLVGDAAPLFDSPCRQDRIGDPMPKTNYHYNIMLRPNRKADLPPSCPPCQAASPMDEPYPTPGRWRRTPLSGYIKSLKKHKEPVPTDDETLLASLDLDYSH